MKARWLRLVAFLGETEDGAALALARIAFGVVVLGTVLSHVARGTVDALFLSTKDGGMLDVGNGPYLVAWLGGPSPGVVWSLIVVAGVSAALLIVGWGGRITPFVVLQTFQAVIGINGTASASHTILITNGLWLLVLADATRTLSLDAWLRTRRFVVDDPVSAWPRRLMILQIVFVYTMSGVHKVSTHWTPLGDLSAIYFILRAPNWSTVGDPSLLVTLFPLTQLATLSTWLFEWGAPLLLVWMWLRRDPARAGRLARLARRVDYRLVWVAMGAGMHAGIELTMNVGPFSYASVAYYVALFSGDEVRRFVDRRILRRS